MSKIFNLLNDIDINGYFHFMKRQVDCLFFAVFLFFAIPSAVLFAAFSFFFIHFFNPPYLIFPLKKNYQQDDKYLTCEVNQKETLRL